MKILKNFEDKTKERLKAIENKNKKQLKTIENQGRKQLDAIEKNNQLKDDGTKSIVLLKDGLEELIKSYPMYFSTFVKSELKQLAASEENIDYKKMSQEIFLMALVFLKDIASHTYF